MGSCGLGVSAEFMFHVECVDISYSFSLPGDFVGEVGRVAGWRGDELSAPELPMAIHTAIHLEWARQFTHLPSKSLASPIEKPRWAASEGGAYRGGAGGRKPDWAGLEAIR